MGRALPLDLEGTKDTDIFIGVPLYNNAGTLGGILEAIGRGISRHFSGTKAILLCSDGGSTDGSEEIIRETIFPDLQIFFSPHPVSPVHKLLTPYHGHPGKELALKAIFETAQRLSARACAVVDPGLSSITPEWISLLLRPIIEEDFDFIAPFYARHPFEGTISSGILYPLHRVLYRKIIRYPIASDFGASGDLLRHLLARKIAEAETARSGVDLWIPSQALTGGFKVGQAFLGPRVQNVRNGQGNLGAMFHQALSTAYGLMDEHESFWRENGEIQSVPAFGNPEGNPPGGSFDPKRMIANFRLGAKALIEIWRKILSPETARGLDALPRLPDSRFSFPVRLWARVIYDFAAGFHRGLVHRDHLLKSLIPLYLGWVASFYQENRNLPAPAVEEKIEELCRVFEDQKAYLLERWEGKGG